MNRQNIIRGWLLFLPCLFFMHILLSREKNEFYYELHVVQRNISLDEIVAQLPNCTEGDRDRQHALLINLRAWSIFATEHRIVYWITFGTLVGYVQRHGLLPHDADVDIVIPWQETEKLERLSRTDFSNQFYLLIQPLWRYPYYENRSYFDSEGITFVAPNARFCNRKEGRFVDIWPSYERMPNLTTNSLSPIDRGTIIDYDPSYNLIESPRNWFYPLQECEFSGIPVWCPAKPEEIVARVYGEKTLRTSDTVCRNGTWQ